jgi:hypothetical protein
MIELSQNPSSHADMLLALAPDLSREAPQNERVVLDLPLPYRAMFYPLGFAVEVVTNEEAVLAVVDAYWGSLRQLHANPPLQVRIEVREGGSPECPPAPILRAQRNLFTIVADAHNHAVCDLTHDISLVWLSCAALQHPEYLYYHFIESAAWLPITAFHTTAIHAACVSRYGHGMLLSGVSGAGKSSLAYACAKAGWTYTSDDGSFLLRGGDGPRVIGDCRQIRFRPSAKELFPELQGRDLTSRIQGKPSIEVPTSELRLITAEQATIHSIVFLNRQPSAVAELLPLPPGTAIRRFGEFLDIDEVRDLQLANLQRLASIDAYELHYRDLQPAIDRLDLLARGPGTPVV